MASKTVPRWMRALTLALVIFTVGLVSHVAAHGAIPDDSALVGLFALTVLALAPFSGVAISPSRAAALLIGGQGLLHAAFQLFGGSTISAMPASCAAAMGAAASSPTSSDVMGSHLMTPPGTASHGFAASQVSGGHAVMLLAHLAAAIVAGVWLAAGERAFWTLLELAARSLVDAWQTVRDVARDRVDTAVVGPRCPFGMGLPRGLHGSGWAAGVVSQRGPPAHAVA